MIYSLAPKKMEEITENIHLYADSISGNSIEGFTIYYPSEKQSYIDNIIHDIGDIKSNLVTQFENL